MQPIPEKYAGKSELWEQAYFDYPSNRTIDAVFVGDDYFCGWETARRDWKELNPEISELHSEYKANGFDRAIASYLWERYRNKIGCPK